MYRILYVLNLHHILQINNMKYTIYFSTFLNICLIMLIHTLMNTYYEYELD